MNSKVWAIQKKISLVIKLPFFYWLWLENHHQLIVTTLKYSKNEFIHDLIILIDIDYDNSWNLKYMHDQCFVSIIESRS